MFVISHRIFTERGGFYHKNTADQHIFTNKGNVNLSDELQMMQKNTFLTIILWSSSHISDGFILHVIGLLIPPDPLA